MLKNKIFLFFFFAMIGFSSIFAGNTNEFDSLITTGIHQIYNLKFENAEKTFDYVEKNYPEHPSGKFFDAMIIWWKIMLDLDNEKYDDIFYEKLESTIDFCDDILDENPDNVDAIFFKGGSIGFRGRLRALRESWFKAAVDGKDALPLVFKAAELEPGNIDVMLGFGIYNYYAAVIPEKYSFAKPLLLFMPDGDREKGIEQLKIVAEKGNYAKYESRYFLMTLYYGFEENNIEAKKYANLLIDDFPDNPVFQRYLGRLYVRNGELEKAKDLFKIIYNRSLDNDLGYDEKVKREAAYYIGLSYKTKKDFDSAKVFFKKTVDLSKKVDEKEESGFWVNSLLFLGNLSDVEGARSEAREYYNAVLKAEEFKDSHDKAKKFLKKPYS